MTEIIRLACIYEGSRDLKDRTKKLTFQTNEITPEQAANLQMCVQNFVYILIKPEDFTKDEIKEMTEIKTVFEDTGKTPSQRLRSVLFRLWQQDSHGYKDFNIYYQYRIEILLNHFKSQLI